MGEDNLSIKARQAIRHIRNWVMQYGLSPSVRELMKLMDYKSPRSAVLLLEELEENGFLNRKEDGSFRLVKDLEKDANTRTVAIPLVGYAPCGSPLLAEENIEAIVSSPIFRYS